jgi:hypothetical protein
VEARFSQAKQPAVLVGWLVKVHPAAPIACQLPLIRVKNAGNAGRRRAEATPVIPGWGSESEVLDPTCPAQHCVRNSWFDQQHLSCSQIERPPIEKKKQLSLQQQIVLFGCLVEMEITVPPRLYLRAVTNRQQTVFAPFRVKQVSAKLSE